MKQLLSVSLCSLAMATASAARAADNYASVVLQDKPLALYRFADVTPPDVAANTGSLGVSGNGLYVGAGHRVAGALSADPNAAASFDGSGARVAVPFNAALNPPAAKPFTIEAWVMPTMDGQSPAQAPLSNLHTNGNYQGWAVFQQASGTGFNFQMFNQNGGSPSVNITGGAYTVGQWNHLVAVWNGSLATFYVNGANVGTQAGLYVANPDAPFSIGSLGGNNPFTGSLDEVAFYTNALTSAQVYNHYTNGLNATSLKAYRTQVLADGAVEYLRLDEPNPATNAAVNYGLIGASGDGAHFPGAVHSVPGALAGVADTAMHYWDQDTNTEDGGFPTIIPYNATLNQSTSFSVECWIRPTEDGNASNAQSPLFNRDPGNVSNRQGWDFFQRPHGTGWNFRMFCNSGSSKAFNITGGPYTVGNWSHIVMVYDATVPSAKMYQNGTLVASQSGYTTAPYSPTPYAPMSIGSYSDGSQNPFQGDIDEFAYYTNALTTTQVLNHYQNGINASRAVAYDQLILSDSPAEYLRMDEPARAAAASIGVLSNSVSGTYVNTTNLLAGPASPTDAGFSTTNLATYFNAGSSYIELGNPDSLNFSNHITLEAWILPASTQNSDAYIIAHGDNDDYSGSVFLRIENGAYEAGSVNTYASSAIPDGDLGGTNWIHLAGTWDGTNWVLFRNGIPVASTASPAGPTLVKNADWAIGARGKFKYSKGLPNANEENVFAGGIDEAAVYNTALTASQVAAHYSAGAYGSAPLTGSVSGGNFNLNWHLGTLQESTNLAGPYADVNNTGTNSEPVSSANGKFYRLKF